jgi:predicted acyl esterase
MEPNAPSSSRSIRVLLAINISLNSLDNLQKGRNFTRNSYPITMLKNKLLIAFIILGFSSFGQPAPTFDDIMIPMRDGEFLEVDVYIPAGADSCEVILIQTPYDKDNFEAFLPIGVGLNLDSQPFAWVIADWRGFYGSSGADLSNFERGEDGYDICEWIVDQPWHLDRIGTWGPSALGGVQYLTAREQHPNHTCAVPLVAHPHTSYESYFTGGVLEEARLNTLDALGYWLSPLVLANTYYSNAWAFSENSSWYPSDIQIPTLQIGGWYDHNIDKMMTWYEATRNSAQASVQDQQYLLVGPWVHGGNGAAYVGSSTQGELTYPNAEFVSDTMAWDFFQYYLLDAPNNWQNTDNITYYELGANTWNTSNATTIDEQMSDVLYFDQSNKLTNSPGITSTGFVSDPSSPAPTIGGANLSPFLQQGPFDQISNESRTDIVTFETFDLPNDISISGRVTLDLYIEADQADCDIMVQLVDVYPDNRNMLITEGARRMRFRNGYFAADEVFMTSGQVYPVQIELPFTNYTWLAGHKIKVYIGGNSSTRWNVNLQDGGPMYQTGIGNSANIEVHHNTTNPSQITLPGNNPILNIDQSEMIEFNVFPVPATNVLTVESNQEIERYEIVDLSGRMQLKGTDVNSINIESLTSGTYFINAISNGRQTSRKFIKL